MWLCLVLPGLGQTGFPFTAKTNTDWDSLNNSWYPIKSYYSGIVERCLIAEIAPPNVDQVQTVALSVSNVITETNSAIYTNLIITAAGTITNKNLQPATYTMTVDGVSCTATAFPLLTLAALSAIDTSLDNLFPRFISQSVTGALNNYQEVMELSTDTNADWVELSAFSESRAHVFHTNAIGIVTNAATNQYGWITNGTALWSAPIRGFAGDFRLGSVNAEPFFLASGFPATNGADFDGGYYWMDPVRVTDWDDVYWFPGGFIKDRLGPVYYDEYGELDIFADANRCIYRQDSTNSYLMTADAEYYWLFYPLTFYGYIKRNGETNWFNYDGISIGTNAVNGSVSNGLAWNYRRGTAWSVGPLSPDYIQAPAESWFMRDGGAMLRYSRTNAAFESVQVTIYGKAFSDDPTNLATHDAVYTASVSTAVTEIPIKFAGVTNITASGTLAAGDSITLAWTNRNLFTQDIATWGTINKLAIDERLKATKALSFTVEAPAMSLTTSIIWQGYSSGHTNAASAYAAAAAGIGRGYTDLGAAPILPNGEGQYGGVYIHENLGQYSCEIVVWRKHAKYDFTGIPTNLPHDLDLLVNIHEIPIWEGSTMERSIYCDVTGFPGQGETWIYTNLTSMTTNQYSFSLRPVNTNAPIQGADYPNLEDVDIETNRIIGFQLPKIQSVFKWKTTY